MAALVLVALALALDNLAACIGIGLSGADSRTRLQVGLTFGFFETATPVLGLLLGHGLAATLGGAARWLGGALLIGAGLYTLIRGLRDGPGRAGPRQGMVRLLTTGTALSVDNLAAGFALGTLPVSLVAAVIVFAAVSVAMSLIGLELGSRIGARAGERGEILGALVLAGVGIALAAGVL